MQINTIQQWPRQFVAIALNHVRRTGTTATRFAKISTGAGIHRGDQLKARREAYAVLGAGNHDVAGFQWLSQHLQYLAIKFREFIEEQHAMVSEGDFARLWFRATAHQCRS
ncbi:hypothetical protein D3C81_1793310 [compost metagenome]